MNYDPIFMRRYSLCANSDVEPGRHIQAGVFGIMEELM